MLNTGWSPFGWRTSPKPSGDPVTTGRVVFLDGDNTDGSNNSTRTNGVAFDNWVNLGTLGGTFSNATGTQQPLFATGLLNGHAGATFDGVDDRLVSSLAASAFTFLHDGSGASVYVVARSPTSAVMTLLATRTTAGTSRGLMVGTNTLYRAQVLMSDGVGVVATVTGAGGSVSNNLFDIVATRLASAASPDLRVNTNGVSVGTTDATAFSASAPAATLHLGSNAVPGSFYGGSILAVLAYNVDHSDTQRAAIEAWAAAKYGVTFPA